MQEDSVDQLSAEYYKLLKKPQFFGTKLSGYFRFQLSNGKIVKKNGLHLYYVIFVIIFTFFCAFYVTYYLYIEQKYLMNTEAFMMLQFAFCHAGFLININFCNRSDGPKLIKNLIRIDALLGFEDTSKLRQIEYRVFNIFQVIISVFACGCTGGLTYVYENLTVSVLVTGVLYCFMVLNVYYDFTLFLYLYTFIELRVCFLNKAITDIGKLKEEYVPNLLKKTLYWRKDYEYVMAKGKNIPMRKLVPAFKLIFNQLRVIEANYRFTVFLFLLSIPLGTFVTVANYTIYVKTPGLPIPRAMVITGWGVTSWLYILFMSLHVDMFYRQIEQTNLICTYTQLKPTSTDQAVKLTKSIIRTLQVRDPRMSIYELYSFDTGLVFGIVSSMFVYITVQLQLLLPSSAQMSGTTTNLYNATSFFDQ